MADEKPTHPIKRAYEAKARAKFHAGLIIEAVLANGWEHSDQIVARYGEDGASKIALAMAELAHGLTQGVRVG